MNAFTPPEAARHGAKHRAYICLGSNINPRENMLASLAMLRERAQVVAVSTCWETEAVQNTAEQSAPNFLNMAVCIDTFASPAELKETLLAPIENALGRVRTADKYAPRTMDLDIAVYDDQVLDGELWRRLYLALCFAELLPNLRNPQTGETLAAAAERLRQGRVALPHSDLLAER